MLLHSVATGSANTSSGSGIDAGRPALDAACTDFMNALFDCAATSTDLQHHAHTLRLLRELRERRDAILDALQADLSRSLGTRRSTGAIPLHALLERHFAPLEPSVVELGLLEQAFSQRLLHQGQTRPIPAVQDHEPAVTRMMTRLRISSIEPQTAATTPPQEETLPAATHVPRTSTDTPSRGYWRHVLLLPLALLLLSVPEARSTFMSSVQATPRAPTMMQTANAPPVGARNTAAPTRDAAAPPAAITAAAPAPHAAILPPQAADSSPDLQPVAAAPATTPETAPEPATPVQPPNDTAPQPTLDPRLALQVEFLLQRGDAALAALRLTEPFPDSAAANYAAALAIAPEDEHAREGLERVVAAYAGLIRAAVAERKLPYARTLLERARTVQPASTLLPEIEREISLATVSAR